MPVQLPPTLYTDTWIFHITAIDNLPNILASGGLLATNCKPPGHISIANEEVQRHRATKQVTLPPNGVIHDYVPFYFAPRSPMLYANYRGTHPNARPQSEIVHLCTKVQTIAGAGLPYVFYDHHAVKAFARCFNRLEDLNQIDWDLFYETPLMGGYSQHWKSTHTGANPKWIKRMEVRMAEFLVYQRLDFRYILGIGTQSAPQAAKVQETLQHYGLNTPVGVRAHWYY